ncbi:unnamed protein product [Prorocentrum cordatum]|uniref:Uncharacterized protein n=1 Tax=Prorocentrum cordatum TaxID=2364126 RepID=A0ABN9YBK3_9DINO|nr:unnamed protein product [Polarella glacialis]
MVVAFTEPSLAFTAVRPCSIPASCEVTTGLRFFSRVAGNVRRGMLMGECMMIVGGELSALAVHRLEGGAASTDGGMHDWIVVAHSVSSCLRMPPGARRRECAGAEFIARAGTRKHAGQAAAPAPCARGQRGGAQPATDGAPPFFAVLAAGGRPGEGRVVDPDARRAVFFVAPWPHRGPDSFPGGYCVAPGLLVVAPGLAVAPNSTTPEPSAIGGARLRPWEQGGPGGAPREAPRGACSVGEAPPRARRVGGAAPCPRTLEEAPPRGERPGAGLPPESGPPLGRVADPGPLALRQDGDGRSFAVFGPRGPSPGLRSVRERLGVRSQSRGRGPDLSGSALQRQHGVGGLGSDPYHADPRPRGRRFHSSCRSGSSARCSSRPASATGGRLGLYILVPGTLSLFCLPTACPASAAHAVCLCGFSVIVFASSKHHSSSF